MPEPPNVSEAYGDHVRFLRRVAAALLARSDRFPRASPVRALARLLGFRRAASHREAHGRSNVSGTEVAELGQRITEAVLALEERDRDLLLLHLRGKRTVRDCARELGRSGKDCRRSLRASLDRIRAGLEEFARSRELPLGEALRRLARDRG